METEPDPQGVGGLLPSATSSFRDGFGENDATGQAALCLQSLPVAACGAAKKELVTKPTSKPDENGSVIPTNGDGKFQPKESYLRNGLVTYEVFRNTIQGKLQLGDTLSEQQIFELMQHLDQNHDGVVDYQEFCSFFAEFSRADYLQELFEVDDTKAISLLNRCATLLQNPNKFNSLRDAFDAFDHSKTGKLSVDDILKGTHELNMVPELDNEEAQLLFNSILLSYYGINQRHQWDTRGLDWVVFEDTFSPDSTFQRRLWLASLGASNTNLAALDVRDSLSGDDDIAQEGQASKNQAWADTFVDSVKQSLHEQRLYIKFLFRILDRKRHGYVTKEQFVATMQAINEEHGAPLKLSQLEQLADAFAHHTTVRRPSNAGRRRRRRGRTSRIRSSFAACASLTRARRTVAASLLRCKTPPTQVAASRQQSH